MNRHLLGGLVAMVRDRDEEGLTASIWSRLNELAKLLISACLYYSGLTPLVARWFPRRRPIILCAHRVVSRPDPFFPGILHRRFAAHIAYLARYHRLLPLEEIVEASLNGGPLPRGTVAITFDDGFADNFDFAYPILRRHRVPATIFLIAGSVERGRLPWPERVVYLLQNTDRTVLDITLPEPRVFPLDSQGQRLEALSTLLGLLKNCPNDVRRRAVEELEAALSVGPDQGKMLIWEQCRLMARSGITFGAHTLTHPILPRTDPVEVQSEVSESKTWIEEQLGCRVRYFAYPNDETCPEAVQAVKDAGFEAAFGGNGHVDRVPIDRFVIGRRAYEFGPVCVFAAEVSGILDGLRFIRRRVTSVFRGGVR